MVDKSSYQTSPVFSAISLGPSNTEHYVSHMTDMTMSQVVNMIDMTNEQKEIVLLPASST